MVQAGYNPFSVKPDDKLKKTSGEKVVVGATALPSQPSSDSPYGLNPFLSQNFDHHHSAITVVREWGAQPPTTTSQNSLNLAESVSETNEQLPWERKAAEIEARTRELQRREAELRERERRNMTAIPTKNWPAFFPLVHHNIEAEVPVSGQNLAKKSYFIWQLTAAAYAINLAATVTMLFSGVPGYNSLTGAIFAAIYMVAFPLAAFFAWHLSLYKALKFDSSFWFIVYFVSFGVQLLFYGFLAIGLFSGGGGGLLGMLEMFAHGKLLAGILSAICTAGMSLCLLMGIGLIKQVNDHFRSGGHSVERAGAEAGRNVATNDTVRRTAKETVLGSV